MNEDWSHVILLDLAEAVFYCSNHPRAKMPAKELLENKYMKDVCNSYFISFNGMFV